MSMISNLLLILSSFFILAIYTNYRMINNRKNSFLLNSIKHDIKVPLISILRGIEFLKYNNNPELQKELEKSCKITLDMLEYLYSVFTIPQQNSKSYINLENTVTTAIKKLEKNADLKCIDFYLYIHKNILININKELLETLLNMLISMIIDSSQSDNYIKICIEKSFFGNNIVLSYCGLDFQTPNKFLPVGLNIKLKVCEEIIRHCGWKLYVYKKFENNHSIKIFIPNIELKGFFSILKGFRRVVSM